MNDLFSTQLFEQRFKDESLQETGMTNIIQSNEKDVTNVKIGHAASYNVPVESFGKNILSKLGWKENSNVPIGRPKEGTDYKEPDFKNLMPR